MLRRHHFTVLILPPRRRPSCHQFVYEILWRDFPDRRRVEQRIFEKYFQFLTRLVNYELGQDHHQCSRMDPISRRGLRLIFDQVVSCCV